MKAVAAGWASGRGGAPADDAGTQAAADAIAAIEARRAGGRPDMVAEIGPDEVPAVRLFFTLVSHWRVHPATGVRLGLDYPAVQPTAAMLGLPMTPDLFDDLRVMEGAALTAWAAA